MDLKTLGLILLIPPLLYVYTYSVVMTRFPKVAGKRICLLIAHPDDEAMFFGPTLVALTKPELGNHIKILCLSSGNAEGLGGVRKKELVKSGMVLGLRREEDVFVHDDPELFPDSMTTAWSSDAIVNLLNHAFVPPAANKNQSSSEPPATSIDMLITFDQGGISGHINHRSLYHGAIAWLRSLECPGYASPVGVYTLTSIPIWRKYLSFLETPFTLLSWGFNTGVAKKDKAHPGGLVFLSGLGASGWGRPWKAMTEAHVSQMVWFRYGWILLSRYMVVNDLTLVDSAKAAASKKTL